MSITLNGSTFNLTYTSGIPSDFTEQAGATLRVDAWGMDVLTRKFKGRLDKVATELAKYKRRRDKKDDQYPELAVTDLVMVENSPFAELTVTYKGILGGKVPEPVFKSGYRAATAQLPYTNNSGTETSETITVKYYSPYTTAYYVLDKMPQAAKYRRKIQVTKDALQVVASTSNRAYSIILGREILGGDLSGGVIEIPRVANSCNGSVEITTTQLSFERAGKWWEVTETNEATIVPLSLASRYRVINLARMSIATFIDDLRQVDIPDDFEGGNDNQRAKLNKALQVLRDFKAAAERFAGPDGDGNKIQIYVSFNGALTLVEFQARVTN